MVGVGEGDIPVRTTITPANRTLKDLTISFLSSRTRDSDAVPVAADFRTTRNSIPTEALVVGVVISRGTGVAEATEPSMQVETKAVELMPARGMAAEARGMQGEARLTGKEATGAPRVARAMGAVRGTEVRRARVGGVSR